jgi:hypothetical protein
VSLLDSTGKKVTITLLADLTILDRREIASRDLVLVSNRPPSPVTVTGQPGGLDQK